MSKRSRREITPLIKNIYIRDFIADYLYPDDDPHEMLHSVKILAAKRLTSDKRKYGISRNTKNMLKRMRSDGDGEMIAFIYMIKRRLYELGDAYASSFSTSEDDISLLLSTSDIATGQSRDSDNSKLGSSDLSTSDVDTPGSGHSNLKEYIVKGSSEHDDEDLYEREKLTQSEPISLSIPPSVHAAKPATKPMANPAALNTIPLKSSTPDVRRTLFPSSTSVSRALPVGISPQMSSRRKIALWDDGLPSSAAAAVRRNDFEDALMQGTAAREKRKREIHGDSDDLHSGSSAGRVRRRLFMDS